jgi:hypothetical protein
MTGVAAATLGVGLATTAATMYSGAKQREAAQQGVDVASNAAAKQDELQRAIADRQYRLSTAGQTDERGNQLVYDPRTNEWKSILSPEGQALLNRSDAITRMHDVETLGRGASERSVGYQRRLQEGETASPILDALRYNYGGPTKEGVVGANKVAGVTGASESADLARGAYTGAALRTGFGYAPLEKTLASVDRSATTGIRSALANADASGNSAYEGARNEFQSPRLNMYNALATRASNTENIPFTPSNIPDTVAAGELNRSVRAPIGTSGAYAALGPQAAASQNLINAIGKYPADTTGQAVGTAGNAFLEYLKSQTKTTPAGAPTISRTSSASVPYQPF